MTKEPFSHYTNFSTVASKVGGPHHLLIISGSALLLIYETCRLGGKKIYETVQKKRAEKRTVAAVQLEPIAE